MPVDGQSRGQLLEMARPNRLPSKVTFDDVVSVSNATGAAADVSSATTKGAWSKSTSGGRVKRAIYYIIDRSKCLFFLLYILTVLIRMMIYLEHMFGEISLLELVLEPFDGTL